MHSSATVPKTESRFMDSYKINQRNRQQKKKKKKKKKKMQSHRFLMGSLELCQVRYCWGKITKVTIVFV